MVREHVAAGLALRHASRSGDHCTPPFATPRLAPVLCLPEPSGGRAAGTARSHRGGGHGQLRGAGSRATQLGGSAPLVTVAVAALHCPLTSTEGALGGGGGFTCTREGWLAGGGSTVEGHRAVLHRTLRGLHGPERRTTAGPLDSAPPVALAVCPAGLAGLVMRAAPACPVRSPLHRAALGRPDLLSGPLHYYALCCLAAPCACGGAVSLAGSGRLPARSSAGQPRACDRRPRPTPPHDQPARSPARPRPYHTALPPHTPFPAWAPAPRSSSRASRMAPCTLRARRCRSRPPSLSSELSSPSQRCARLGHA